MTILLTVNAIFLLLAAAALTSVARHLREARRLTVIIWKLRAGQPLTPAELTRLGQERSR